MPAHKLPPLKYKWTPELAYAVGLLVTDGCMYRDGRHINFTSKDLQLIEAFKSCLGLENKVQGKSRGGSKKKDCFQITFGRVQLYQWLIGIGLSPAKTHTIGKIKVPNKYFSNFVRGHLDGDGSIISYYDNYENYHGRTYNNFRVYTRFISASKLHAEWLYKKITEITGIKGAIIINKPRFDKHVPLYQIKFSKKSSLELFKWIYYNKSVPCLKRKRDIAERAIIAAKNETRKPYRFIN